MDKTDIKLLKLTQDGIPILPEPFKHIAGELGLSEKEILERLNNMVKEGVIRRFGALSGTGQLGLRQMPCAHGTFRMKKWKK